MTKSNENTLFGGFSVAKVKYMRGHTEHEPAMTCSIIYDGKEVATVFDDSYGGGYQFTWKSQHAKKVFDAYVASVGTIEFEGLKLKYDGDLFVGDMVSQFQFEKEVKRKCKTKTIFSLKEDEKHSYRTINYPFDEKVKAHLVKKYGVQNLTIWNERLKA